MQCCVGQLRKTKSQNPRNQKFELRNQKNQKADWIRQTLPYTVPAINQNTTQEQNTVTSNYSTKHYET